MKQHLNQVNERNRKRVKIVIYYYGLVLNFKLPLFVKHFEQYNQNHCGMIFDCKDDLLAASKQYTPFMLASRILDIAIWKSK